MPFPTTSPVDLDFVVSVGETADRFVFPTAPVVDLTAAASRMEVWTTGTAPVVSTTYRTTDSSMVNGGVAGTLTGAATSGVPAAAGAYRYEHWVKIGSAERLCWRGRVTVRAKLIGTLP